MCNEYPDDELKFLAAFRDIRITQINERTISYEIIKGVGEQVVASVIMGKESFINKYVCNCSGSRT